MCMLAFDRRVVVVTARCIALCLCLAGLSAGAAGNDCFAEGKGSNDGKYIFRYSGEGYALDKLVTTDNVWVWDDEE